MRFHLKRFAYPSANRGSGSNATVNVPPQDMRFPPERRKLRRLAIEMTPDTLRAYWEREHKWFATALKPNYLSAATRILAGNPPRLDGDPPAAFACRGRPWVVLQPRDARSASGGRWKTPWTR